MWPVASDEYGIEPEVLRQLLAKGKAEGNPPKICYFIPTFNNPKVSRLTK